MPRNNKKWFAEGAPVEGVRAKGGTKERATYDVAKAPVGWVVLLDRVRVGGVYGTKEAALEAAAVAAAFAVRDGDGVQINVPGVAKEGEVEGPESWPKEWDALLKR
jgi:hypothetical protein